MEPIVIERCTTPRGELQLQKRGDHYEIISNGTFLMATYNGESERVLVKAAIDALPDPGRILIGGLGVGFSLAEALANTRTSKVTVLEIEEKIVAWNQNQLAPFSGHALGDPRVEIIQADLVAWVEQATDRFDAVCLDIDNGPDWTVTDANRHLYSDQGLLLLRGLISRHGVVSFWSASAVPQFAARLRRIFSTVETIEVPLERGEPDYVYLARR